MLTRAALATAERAWVPDAVIRRGIRALLRARLDGMAGTPPAAARSSVIERMNASPIALAVQDANAQHYEVPAAFFERILGPHMKYSCAWWDERATTLEAAERAMLALTCERADIRDGHRILELGCGWGSLSLWMAEHYPHADILAVSNSRSQRSFIEQRAAARSLSNVRVVTADMNDFEPPHAVDRIVSVEMFEHMRNHGRLLRRMAEWMDPRGLAFIHIFCHRDTPYFFEVADTSDWMAKHFFTGGMMPSADLFSAFTDAMRVDTMWSVDGRHYARTLLAWLDRLDGARPELLEIFNRTYGADAARWLQRWRLFLLACAELFAYRDGTEWFVAHYRLAPAAAARAAS